MINENDVKEMIAEIGGPEAVEIYKMLAGKQDVDEFLIADKLKMTINHLRNTMYKFERYNLVSSTRKKDRKKGWYIYFYTFNPKQAEDVVLQLKKDRINILEKQLEREEMHEFYVCQNKCIRLTIENAMEHNFTCFECGSLLNPEDKIKNVQKIKDYMNELKKKVNEFEKPAPEVKKPKEIKTEVKTKHKVKKEFKKHQIFKFKRKKK